MEIYKIAIVGIVGAILAVIVRSYNKEYTVLVSIATVLVIFTMIIFKLNYVFEFLESLYDKTNYGKAYLPIVLKILCVAYITDFAAQICKDVGENAIGMKVELAGKLIIFYLAIPVMVSVIDVIGALLTTI